MPEKSVEKVSSAADFTLIELLVSVTCQIGVLPLYLMTTAAKVWNITAGPAAASQS